MTKQEAIEALNEIALRQSHGSDKEEDHVEADGILLDLIDDPEVREAFAAIDKWYA